MLRDNLVELIEPMLSSAGTNPLALTHHQIQASGDRLPCLENPRPKGAQSSLTENAPSPFQAEPAHFRLPRLGCRTLHDFCEGCGFAFCQGKTPTWTRNSLGWSAVV